jgi:hypothetical protein
MTLALAPSPILAPGGADELAERWIDKMLDQWMTSLQGESGDVVSRLISFLKDNRIGANPVAQRKWADRLRKRFPDRLLALTMAPGKRNNHAFALDLLMVTGAFRSVAEDKRRQEAGISVRQTWLTGLRISRSNEGPHKPAKVGCHFVVGASRHALKRIIQRCAIHTAEDLHTAIRAAWPTLSKAEALTREARKARLSDAWLVPVTLPSMADPVVFVLSGPSEGDTEDLAFVKTVFPLSFLNDTELANVLALHSLLSNTTIIKIVMDHLDDARAMIDAVKTSEDRPSKEGADQGDAGGISGPGRLRADRRRRGPDRQCP